MHIRLKATFVLGLLMPVLAGLDAAGAEYNQMLVIGNSLTWHTPSGGADGLSWNGNWGMAASARDKDYAHQLHARLQADQPGVTLNMDVGYIFDERLSMTGVETGGTFDGTSMTQSNADLLIFQLGDNFVGTLNWDVFGQNYKNTIQQVAAGGNNPDIYIIGTWRYAESDYKTRLIQQVAYEVGATYVNIDAISDNPAYWGTAEPYCDPAWYTNGVGTHPGDTGMAVIADKIYGMITAPAPVIRTPDGPNLLSNGSFEDAYVQEGTAVSTSSIDMNGWTQVGTNPQIANVASSFDRTGEDFLVTWQVCSLSQVADAIEADKKYTFLIDVGYSVSWNGLADGAFVAIAEYDADGNWVRDLAMADDLFANQSGLAYQVVLEYITEGSVTEGNQVGVRIGIDSTPALGCGVLWDNASLTAVNVPEPASMGMLALGGLAVLGRRKHQLQSN